MLKSATGKIWKERLETAKQPLAVAMAQRFQLNDIITHILVARDVTLETVEDFLNPTLRTFLPDPLSLTDMQTAAERFCDAIQKQENITIFGDYDVDGACSSALLAQFTAYFDIKTNIYIPDRITEGYGPNVIAIEEIAKYGCNLLITVDCGATSFAPLEAAKVLNLDVIVLDHHQMSPEIPPAVAVVNPNRQDDLSNMNDVCAAGVVFIFLVQCLKIMRERGCFDTMQEPNLLLMLDIVALATVADVVPLKGLNRAFVTQGLKVLATRNNVGLVALSDAARIAEMPSPYHLGYILGPRINAGGRIGDAALGARLLTTRNLAEAAEIAQTLERLNKERQIIEMHHVDEAIAQMDTKLALTSPNVPYALATGENWHVGVVGLVAARLKERFNRPSFAFAINGELATCSARSVVGVDIGAIVRDAVKNGILLKGGGHAMAAGLTIELRKLPEFEVYLQEKLAAGFAQISSENAQVLIDSYIGAKTASVEFIKNIQSLGPYGSNMPEPVFGFLHHTLSFVEELKNNHLRLTIKAKDGTQLKAMAWRAVGTPLGDFLQANRGKSVHICGTLAVDVWQGNEKASMRVIDAKRT